MMVCRMPTRGSSFVKKASCGCGLRMFCVLLMPLISHHHLESLDVIEALVVPIRHGMRNFKGTNDKMFGFFLNLAPRVAVSL
jgi:hypothetical protein